MRIFNGCEEQIENSVTRDKRSASLGKPCDAKQLSRVTEFSIRTEQPLWIPFLAYFSFDNSFLKSLNMSLIYEFYAKITEFFIKKCSIWFLSKTLTSEHLAESDVKNWCCDIKNWCHYIKKTTWYQSCTRVALLPLHVRQHFLAPVVFTEIPVGYARMWLSHMKSERFVWWRPNDLKANHSDKMATFD